MIKTFSQQDWLFLLKYYFWKYKTKLKPVQRRKGKTISEDIKCPVCGAPHHYIYDKNGGNGQYQCKICGQTFSTSDRLSKPFRLIFPYCGHTLEPKKNRKFFRVHKCINPNCSFYLHNLEKIDKDLRDDSVAKSNTNHTTSTVNSL